MISAIFIDRPRLAVVIAVVITIAGALALMRIPVAQLPDIVPPQVAGHGGISRRFGCRRRGQSGGADRGPGRRRRRNDLHEITSGNDGSYSLTVSFVLGSDPDINTVNVNNRVQTALAQLPRRCSCRA